MQSKSLLYRLWWLFRANVIISCLAVGGGYVIIPLIKKQFVDNAKVFSFDELMEMAAIAQSAPGAIAINLSAIAGYKVSGFLGSVVSLIAAVLPPLVIMSIVAAFYQKLIDNQEINAALKGMIAAISAIIINVVYDMAKNVARTKEILGLFTAAAVFMSAFIFNVNAILLIVLSLTVYALVFNIRAKLEK